MPTLAHTLECIHTCAHIHIHTHIIYTYKQIHRDVTQLHSPTDLSASQTVPKIRLLIRHGEPPSSPTNSGVHVIGPIEMDSGHVVDYVDATNYDVSREHDGMYMCVYASENCAGARWTLCATQV